MGYISTNSNEIFFSDVKNVLFDFQLAQLRKGLIFFIRFSAKLFALAVLLVHYNSIETLKALSLIYRSSMASRLGLYPFNIDIVKRGAAQTSSSFLFSVFLPWSFMVTFRKHVYSNILKIFPPKNENFYVKNSDIFHISAQNIDCGYSLEPPR